MNDCSKTKSEQLWSVMALLDVTVQHCTSARQLELLLMRKNQLRMHELLMALCRKAFGSACIREATRGEVFAPMDPTFQKHLKQVSCASR